jgi:hypothetical protein
MVTLAFLLGAALVFAVAAPASAAPTTDPDEIARNERFIRFQELEDVVHLVLFGDEGQPSQPPAQVVLGARPLLGFEWTDITVQSLLDNITNNALHDFRVSIDGGAAFSIKASSYQEPFVAVPSLSNPSWQWDHNNDGLGNNSGIPDWDGPVLFVRFEAPAVTTTGTHTYDFDITYDGGTTLQDFDFITIDVFDPCEEEDDCEFDPCADGCEIVVEDDDGNEAEFSCEDCTEPVVVSTDGPDEGDKATFDVDPGNNPKGTVYELVVTMADKQSSTPPGRAAVFVDDEENPLSKCHGSDVNCVVQIKRVKGAKTQYTVRYEVDPRFRFR